jgi:hypothetical protein
MPRIKPLLSYIHGILDEHFSLNQQGLYYIFLHSHLTNCQTILRVTSTENKNRLRLFKRKQFGLLQTADTMSALLLFLTILTFYHIPSYYFKAKYNLCKVLSMDMRHLPLTISG